MAAPVTPTASGVGLDEFESLLAELSGRSINGQRSVDKTFQRTHQWVRDGSNRVVPEVLTGSYPWSGERFFARGERIMLARLGVLERCAWILEGRGQAADRLGLRPSTLRNRMRKLDIQRPPGR